MSEYVETDRTELNLQKMLIRPADACRYDLVSLGEVMLRLDPGESRIHTARTFHAWEGGGEYNVARGLRRCFGLRTAIVTALVDNPIGRLIEDLMLQGGVDTSLVRWIEYDGVGRAARNGLNFTERGFGARGGIGCSDRGNTAVGQLRPEDFDWHAIFGRAGTRWFHTGGIFAALSPTTPAVAKAAMEAARVHGVRISYDFNYRPSLWRGVGPERVREVNRALMPWVDVLFAGEEDLAVLLGRTSNREVDDGSTPVARFGRMAAAVHAEFSGIQTIVTTLRVTRSATAQQYGAVCWQNGSVFEVAPMDVEVLDRVGAGDAVAAGFLYAVLGNQEVSWALRCGLAHGALAMSTPGDNSMATREDVLRVMAGTGARIER